MFTFSLHIGTTKRCGECEIGCYIYFLESSSIRPRWVLPSIGLPRSIGLPLECLFDGMYGYLFIFPVYLMLLCLTLGHSLSDPLGWAEATSLPLPPRPATSSVPLPSYVFARDCLASTFICFLACGGRGTPGTLDNNRFIIHILINMF